MCWEKPLFTIQLDACCVGQAFIRFQLIHKDTTLPFYPIRDDTARVDYVNFSRGFGPGNGGRGGASM